MPLRFIVAFILSDAFVVNIAYQTIVLDLPCICSSGMLNYKLVQDTAEVCSNLVIFVTICLLKNPLCAFYY